MKKTYSIEIDCANCANKVEEACKKVDGISSLGINFMTQKMIIEFSEGVDVDKTMKAVVKTAQKVEDDFEIEL